MAAGQGEIRGSRRLSDALLVPRPAARIGLLLVALVLAEVAWRFLDFKLLSYVSGLAGPACLMCATAVWSMRDKADLVLSGEHLDSSSFRAARNAANALRSRSMLLAARVAVAAGAAFSAVVAANLVGAIWHWMILIAGVGLAEALYAFLIGNHWEEQLRAQRDKVVLQQKQREQQRDLIARIEAHALAARGARDSISPVVSLIAPASNTH